MESHLHDVNLKMDQHMHDVNVISIKMDSLHDVNMKMDNRLQSINIKMDPRMHDVSIQHDNMKMDGHNMHDTQVNMHEAQITQLSQLPLQPQQIHMQPVQDQNIPQNPPELQEQPIKPRVENKKKKEAIDGQAREIIFKVIKFFESEKQNRGYHFPVENVVKRACAATGLSESTIKRIKREGLRAEANQTKMTGPKKKRVRKTKVQLDYFQLCALRGIVNAYSMRKEVPTLGKILTAAKHELNYRGGKESLRLILLNKLGIKFKKCEKKNKKPPEPVAPAQQIMAPVMSHLQMQPMKPENQCIYTNMMPQVPPVSY
ncbi:uncharacterized protein LOC120635710 [Pararge aegeria]|uniref:Jg26375 protein n=1 Tax=Pararge aegeria aegeria TaxID=348720 RepID=A0A8S4R861_9NEOP|nr:uncharacterized protein LOC120635710 [Pararge aegeria]CAH2230680.1 jg26375 [Pararge aegeria aegeria]